MEGIQVEDKGGDVQLVPISALKKINLDILTETILLEAELMNLKGDPTGLVEGVIIEAKIDKQGYLQDNSISENAFSHCNFKQSRAILLYLKILFLKCTSNTYN